MLGQNQHNFKKLIWKKIFIFCWTKPRWKFYYFFLALKFFWLQFLVITFCFKILKIFFIHQPTRCSPCKRKEIVKKKCTAISDTVCGCPQNHVYNRLKPCMACPPVSWTKFFVFLLCLMSLYHFVNIESFVDVFLMLCVFNVGIRCNSFYF